MENYDGDIFNKGLEDIQTLVFETTFCVHDDDKAMKKICQRQSLEEEQEEEAREEEEARGEEEGSDVEWQREVELSPLLASDSEWDSRVLCPDCGTFIKGSKAHLCEHAKPFVCQDCGKRFVNETTQHSPKNPQARLCARVQVLPQAIPEQAGEAEA